LRSSLTRALLLQYLVNHYLDVNTTIFGQVVPVPATSALEETNALTGTGSLGAQASTCLAEHGYYPTFTLVDYYDVGNGSVFGASALSVRSSRSRGIVGCGRESERC